MAARFNGPTRDEVSVLKSSIVMPEQTYVVRHVPVELQNQIADLVGRIREAYPDVWRFGKDPTIGIVNPAIEFRPGEIVINNLMFKAECCEIFARFGIPHYTGANGVLVIGPGSNLDIPEDDEDFEHLEN